MGCSLARRSLPRGPSSAGVFSSFPTALLAVFSSGERAQQLRGKDIQALRVRSPEVDDPVDVLQVPKSKALLEALRSPQCVAVLLPVLDPEISDEVLEKSK